MEKYPQFKLYSNGAGMYSQAELNKLFQTKGLEFLASPTILNKHKPGLIPIAPPLNEAEARHQTYEKGVINDFDYAPPSLLFTKDVVSSADMDDLHKVSITARMAKFPLSDPTYQAMVDEYEREMEVQNMMFQAFEEEKREKIMRDVSMLRSRGYTDAEVIMALEKKRQEDALTLMNENAPRRGTIFDRPSPADVFSMSMGQTDPRGLSTVGGDLGEIQKRLLDKAIEYARTSDARMNNMLKSSTLSQADSEIAKYLADKRKDVPAGKNDMRRVFINLVRAEQ